MVGLCARRVRTHTASKQYREPVLERLLDEERLQFAAVGRFALPGGRQAVLYRATASATPSAALLGENLVTATDRQGGSLFSVATVEWDLPAGRRFVVVPRDNRPLEFQYVYVPDATQLLRWQVVKNPHAMCDDSNYRVTVFDLNSRRGPTRTESRVFRVSQLERQELASLPMDVFRGQIVTIQLSSLAETSASESCVAWSDLSLVAAPVASASDGPRGEYRR